MLRIYNIEAVIKHGAKTVKEVNAAEVVSDNADHIHFCTRM